MGLFDNAFEAEPEVLFSCRNCRSILPLEHGTIFATDAHHVRVILVRSNTEGTRVLTNMGLILQEKKQTNSTKKKKKPPLSQCWAKLSTCPQPRPNYAHSQLTYIAPTHLEEANVHNMRAVSTVGLERSIFHNTWRVEHLDLWRRTSRHAYHLVNQSVSPSPPITTFSRATTWINVIYPPYFFPKFIPCK